MCAQDSSDNLLLTSALLNLLDLDCGVATTTPRHVDPQSTIRGTNSKMTASLDELKQARKTKEAIYPPWN